MMDKYISLFKTHNCSLKVSSRHGISPTGWLAGTSGRSRCTAKRYHGGNYQFIVLDSLRMPFYSINSNEGDRAFPRHLYNLWFSSRAGSCPDPMLESYVQDVILVTMLPCCCTRKHYCNQKDLNTLKWGIPWSDCCQTWSW